MTSRHGRGPGDMDAGGRRRPTPAELDALLDGASSGSPELDRLMSAARAPGRPDELRGLDAALDALAAAPPTPATRTRRALTRIGAATVATKIVVLTVGAAAVGGVVVAGETGHLPGQHRNAPPASTSSASEGPSPSGSPSVSAPTSDPRTRTSGSAEPSGSLDPSDLPSAASVPQLCRQWLALPPGSGQIRSEAKFRVLVRAAGGKSSVSGYCRRLAATSSPVPSPSDAIPSRRKIVSPTPTQSRSRTSASASESGD